MTPQRFHSEKVVLSVYFLSAQGLQVCLGAATLLQQQVDANTSLFTPHSQYLMSSNSPSGGMKLMLLSESNLLSLTHWWKVQSSMAIDCLPLKTQNTVREAQAAALLTWCS